MLEVDSLCPIEERFPDIAFHLAFSEFASYELFQNQHNETNARRSLSQQPDFLHSQSSIQEEVDRWRASLQLEQVEILYLYGIGLGYYYEAVKIWLKDKPERRLIFIEDDLAVLASFLKIAPDCACDPQVQIRFVAAGEKMDAVLEELAYANPCDRIEVSFLEAKRRRAARLCRRIRLQLLRKTAIVSALAADVLYTHKLAANLFKNFAHWHEAFNAGAMAGQFKDIPAIICGAGPSLKKSIPWLKKCEDKALILAGGSAFTALSAHNIVPHIGLALDPNPDEYLRLKPNCAFETPMIYGNRVLPDIFNTFNGPKGYLNTQTGGLCEEWLQEKLGIALHPIGSDLNHEAMSVTTLAIAFAYAMGCNPIILTGVDLAFTDALRYAPGVVIDAGVDLDPSLYSKACNRLIRKKDKHGHFTQTLVKWVMESASISAFAKEHPERVWIDSTYEGIGFKKLAFQPLNEAIEDHCQKSYDLRARVHQCCQAFALPEAVEVSVKAQMQLLHASLLRCQRQVSEMLEELKRVQANLHDPSQALETGKMVILELDFQDEPAFECFLSPQGPVIDRLMQRSHIQSVDHSDEAGRKSFIKNALSKWDYYRESLARILSSFSDPA